VFLVLAGALAWSSSLQGDELLLTQGGRIEGQWFNREEQPLSQYQMRTASGVLITIGAAQVERAERRLPAEDEYTRRAPLAADTPAAQWELAEWCRRNHLIRERKVHLARVVALDPDHAQARQALGFRFLNGQWTTRDDFFRREGYELFRGKWRTPQEIEILQTQSRLEQAEKEWLVKLRRWRSDLDSDRAKTAQASLMAIQDPVAVRPLADCMARERVRRVKMLYADVLANIQTPEAVGVLVERSLADADEEVFHHCLDRLCQHKPPRVGDRYIDALKDASNVRVNRAAVALARLQDQAAVSPLIDALITTHAQVLPGRPGMGPDATTATFSDSGSFSKRGEGPQVLIVHMQNQHVLDALNKLTGVSFGFDLKAWRYWYAQEQISREAGQARVEARRP